MARFEEGDTVVIAQDGFYRGVEATVEEVLEDGNVIVDLPVGFYNQIVEKSSGDWGYAWHGESTMATFHEDELVEENHDDADDLRSLAIEIADHPSEFGKGGDN